MDSYLSELVTDRIRDRQLNIVVLGCGYVGLPTAVLFADAGFSVTAVDIKHSIVKNINNCKSPISESGLNELLSRNVQAGRLKAVLPSELKLTTKSAIIICVQTPINLDNKPDLSYLTTAIELIGKQIQKEIILAICSTVPPQTINQKIRPFIESISSLSADNEFYLAYVPERIAPGKSIKEFIEGPRLVGGIGPNSTKIISELFKTVCKKILQTDAITAEIAKTAENTFRDINIAFANQLALICEQNNADVIKMIKLANTHPRVNIHSPGPGVGGPCLTKDPYLLTHNTTNQTPSIITTAREINNYMPNHIIELTLSALKNSGKNIKASKIALLGTAYKANVDDPRFSPSESVVRHLIHLGCDVITYDPHCDATFGAKKANFQSEAFKNTDCLILMVDHNEFKHLNLSEIIVQMNTKPVIIDGKRIIDPCLSEKLGFIYYGIGYGKSTNHQDKN